MSDCGILVRILCMLTDELYKCMSEYNVSEYNYKRHIVS